MGEDTVESDSTIVAICRVCGEAFSQEAGPHTCPGSQTTLPSVSDALQTDIPGSSATLPVTESQPHLVQTLANFDSSLQGFRSGAEPEALTSGVSAQAATWNFDTDPTLPFATQDCQLDQDYFVGRSIGDYKILEPIASGGMGVVYRAHQKSLNRVVALKMIRTQNFPSKHEIARFITEATVIATIDHPNIVPIYEVGFDQQQHFFSMRLVEGGSLANAIERGPLRVGYRGGVRASAFMLKTIAQAVHAAHRHGVLHRDLKPGNILLDSAGEPRVADFGLAKRIDGDSQLTRSGEILGTPSYMAPEQAIGNANITVAADVYSLGAILYEMLTGQPPFRGSNLLETLRQVKEEEVRPPRNLVPTIPRDLETICLKCLQKDANKRYPSAGALAEDLKRWLFGEPIHARRISNFEYAVKWARRKPAPAALIGLLLAMALVGFPGAMMLLSRTERARAAEAKARKSLEVDDYFKRISLAEQNLLLNHLKPVDELLGDCPQGLRGWEWDYLSRWYRVEPFTQLGSSRYSQTVSFSADSRWLAVGYDDGSVAIFERPTTSVPRDATPRVRINAHSTLISSLQFLPDSRRLATTSGDGTIKVWDVYAAQEMDKNSIEPSRIIPVEGAPPESLAVSNAGNLLAAGCSDGFIHFYIPDSGERIKSIPAHKMSITTLEFSPDDQHLASGSRDAAVHIWEVGTGQKVLTFAEHKAPVDAVAWAPGGDWLASASMDTTLRVWNAKTGALKFVGRGHNAPIFGVAISPDGSRVATSSMDKTLKLWASESGREVMTLHGHKGLVFRVDFSPDGQSLASVGTDGAKLWNASPVDESTRQELRTYRGHSLWTFASVYHPSKGFVGSVSGDGSVHLWDPETGETKLVFKGHLAPVFSLSFHPDGNKVASCDASGTTLLWDIGTGNVIRKIQDQDHPETYHVAWNPDGKAILTSGSRGILKLYDSNSGELIREYLGHKSAVWSAEFSPDGKKIVSGGFDSLVGLWSVDSPKPVALLTGHKSLVRSVAFKNDGMQIVSAGNDGFVKVWDYETRKELSSFDDRGPDFESVTFSPDGRYIAAGCENGKILVWNLADGSLAKTLRGHVGLVHGLSFNPTGERLVSASWDGTVKIWETRLRSSNTK